MAQNNTPGDNRIDDNANNTRMYGSNVRLTDDPRPDDVDKQQISDTHPQTDSNIDRHELYDEGLSGAAEADDPTVR